MERRAGTGESFLDLLPVFLVELSNNSQPNSMP